MTKTEKQREADQRFQEAVDRQVAKAPRRTQEEITRMEALMQQALTAAERRRVKA